MIEGRLKVKGERIKVEELEGLEAGKLESSETEGPIEF